MPHWSEYRRETSFPLKSLMDTGALGMANFSPKAGEAGSNSEEKSSETNPVKATALATLVQMKKSALACIESSSVTSLRSHRGRVEPAKGATSPDSGEMLK